MLVFLIWNCKQKPNSTQPKVEKPKQLTEDIRQLSPVIIELVEFMDRTHADTTDINKLIHFKGIDENGVIETIDSDRYVKLYKEQMNSQQVGVLPIFELRNTNKTVLMVNGKGYAGSIWAKILVDKTTQEIEKIEFGHKAESEGYGAAFTQTSFENQFVGAKINFESNTFTVNQGGRHIDSMIDVISGATETSEAAVKMVNEGLQKYRGYLSQG